MQDLIENERWVSVSARIVCEYIFSGAARRENVYVIGERTSVSLPESCLLPSKAIKSGMITYELTAPNGLVVRAKGRGSYHAWVKRLRRRFGVNAPLKICSLQSGHSEGVRRANRPIRAADEA